jgi:hypothetical protein
LSLIRSEVTSRSNYAIERQPAHRGRGVELLGDRDKGHTMGIEELDQLGEVGKRPRQPVHFVDDRRAFRTPRNRAAHRTDGLGSCGFRGLPRPRPASEHRTPLATDPEIIASSQRPPRAMVLTSRRRRSGRSRSRSQARNDSGMSGEHCVGIPSPLRERMPMLRRVSQWSDWHTSRHFIVGRERVPRIDRTRAASHLHANRKRLREFSAGHTWDLALET